jgi:hypothetical protein
MTSVTRDRCYDFKNIFTETFGENIGVFCKNVIITLVFEKKTSIFWPKNRRKLRSTSTPDRVEKSAPNNSIFEKISLLKSILWEILSGMQYLLGSYGTSG